MIDKRPPQHCQDRNVGGLFLVGVAVVVVVVVVTVVAVLCSLSC